MERMRRHASDSIRGSSTTTSPVPICRAGPFHLLGDSATYTCDALIVATGASARYLGLDSRRRTRGAARSRPCATCDGFFYRSQPVAVIGGGNTAVEEALYLSNIASQVTVVHRRDRFRAEKILANQLIEKSRTGNVAIEWDHVLDEVLGDDAGVTRIRIRGTRSGERKDVGVHGCFIAHRPYPQPRRSSEGQLDMNGGYIRVRGGRGGRRPPRRACPACSRRATWRTTYTARRSPPRAPAAWPRWTPSATWSPRSTAPA